MWKNIEKCQKENVKVFDCWCTLHQMSICLFFVSLHQVTKGYKNVTAQKVYCTFVLWHFCILVSSCVIAFMSFLCFTLYDATVQHSSKGNFDFVLDHLSLCFVFCARLDRASCNNIAIPTYQALQGDTGWCRALQEVARQYNAIQCDARWYKKIQSTNTVSNDVIQDYTKHYKVIPDDAGR